VPRLREPHGFALPVTLFAVAIVTLMLSVVFIRVQTDRRIAESSGDRARVFTVAQSGLQTYLGTVSFDGCDRAIRPLDGDSVRINVQGGHVDVVAHVVQRPADTLTPWMYIVRSTGHLINPTQGQDPQAVRTVAQFAHWSRNSLNVLAAFTAANGIRDDGFNGASGELKGSDQAPSGCKDPDVHALRVPNNRGPSSVPHTLTGLTPYVLDHHNREDTAADTFIDWEGVVTGDIVPDYTSVRFWDASYPVMLLEGNVYIGCGPGTTTGYGLLIVTGDLEISGTDSWCLQWNGVILVGGKIEWGAADQRVDGAVISGMKWQLGQSVAEGDQDGAFLDIDYDSRYVRLALKSLAGFAPVGNAWVDTWATY
jgi:hypothetical protein